MGKYFIEYMLSGSDTPVVEQKEADSPALVLPAFLMGYYGPKGDLTSPPGPEFVKVYKTDPAKEKAARPYDMWKKPVN